MTSCVATICGTEEKRYVVVATDKMLTLTMPNIEYEADYPKTTEITPNCVATTSGITIAFTPILRELNAEIARSGTSELATIADFTRKAYENARNAKLNEEILSTYGIDLQGFYAANLGINNQLMALILQRMQTYNYNLWIMLVGVDSVGGHIYRIENPAQKHCFDSIGYHGIGSGEMHSISTFIYNDYHVKYTSLNRGLVLTYEAKKRSEKATGVGEQTSMFVVSKDKTWTLPQEAISELDLLYKKRLENERKVVSDMETNVSALEIEEKYLT